MVYYSITLTLHRHHIISMLRLFSTTRRPFFRAALVVVCATVCIVYPRETQRNEPVPTFALPPRVTPVATTDPEVPMQKVWPVPNIDRMKREGCVADGLLSGYNRTSKDVQVARDSTCYFFSRAVETWRDSPDFAQVRKIMDEIGRDDVLYGMFIAEAIHKKENYFYYAQNRRFDFAAMCKSGSKNFWGEHTCKPSLEEPEYRAYLAQITHEAMDLGIRVFLFGQVYHQEEDVKKSFVQVVLDDMRAYAKSKNISIVIGAQTNDITDETYLRFFDYIEGGVGLHPDGTVEDHPCFSRWYDNTKKEGWCWALLWHERYVSKAHHVFIHLDWSGVRGDDMSTFALMDTDRRHHTLRTLHQKFTAQNVGFLLPTLTPLPQDNGGCHGPRRRFYSAHMKYGCPDLMAINAIINDAKK